jgi:hypothetical protein
MIVSNFDFFQNSTTSKSQKIEKNTKFKTKQNFQKTLKKLKNQEILK